MRFAHRIALAFVSVAICSPAAMAGAPPPDSAEVCPVPKVVVPRPQDSAEWPKWVAQRVKELQPTTQERKIDRIGWARTIMDARKLAKQHNRPVFLFTHDGRINTGRC